VTISANIINRLVSLTAASSVPCEVLLVQPSQRYQNLVVVRPSKNKIRPRRSPTFLRPTLQQFTSH